MNTWSKSNCDGRIRRMVLRSQYSYATVLASHRPAWAWGTMAPRHLISQFTVMKQMRLSPCINSYFHRAKAHSLHVCRVRRYSLSAILHLERRVSVKLQPARMVAISHTGRRMRGMSQDVPTIRDRLVVRGRAGLATRSRGIVPPPCALYRARRDRAVHLPTVARPPLASTRGLARAGTPVRALHRALNSRP
jgi:hypothetical protein